MNKEIKCEDEYKLCQYCPYGYIIYSDDVETKDDLDGACYETICTLTNTRRTNMKNNIYDESESWFDDPERYGIPNDSPLLVSLTIGCIIATILALMKLF